MSYSICLKCAEMVGAYEKYCPECEKKYKQDKGFWKRPDSVAIYQTMELTTEELKKDKIL